jgi:hypothetical protein
MLKHVKSNFSLDKYSWELEFAEKLEIFSHQHTTFHDIL